MWSNFVVRTSATYSSGSSKGAAPPRNLSCNLSHLRTKVIIYHEIIEAKLRWNWQHCKAARLQVLQCGFDNAAQLWS